MQKFHPWLFSLSLIILLLFVESCVSHDIPLYECTDAVSFSADVHPIIETKCAVSGCHNGDLGQDFNWTDFQTFHQRAVSGLVKFRVTHRIMPPSNSPAGPLSQEQISAIACWTDQGSLNN